MDNGISEATFEFTIEKMAQTIKRLFIVIIVLIIALVGTNLAWVIYENSFEDTVITQEVSQDGDSGLNSFIGGDNVGETNR